MNEFQHTVRPWMRWLSGITAVIPIFWLLMMKVSGQFSSGKNGPEFSPLEIVGLGMWLIFIAGAAILAFQFGFFGSHEGSSKGDDINDSIKPLQKLHIPKSTASFVAIKAHTSLAPSTEVQKNNSVLKTPPEIDVDVLLTPQNPVLGPHTMFVGKQYSNVKPRNTIVSNIIKSLISRCITILKNYMYRL